MYNIDLITLINICVFDKTLWSSFVWDGNRLLDRLWYVFENTECVLDKLDVVNLGDNIPDFYLITHYNIYAYHIEELTWELKKGGC